MSYATVAGVQAHNPYRTIDSNSKPTSTEVGVWITDAEAEVDGLLSALGLTSPCANATGIKILRKRVELYVAGLVAQAYAAAGGDGGNEDGNDAVEKWDAFLESLAADPVKWGGMLQGGAAGDGAIKARSHVTHNQDSLTKTAGDFDAEYEKGDLL